MGNSGELILHFITFNLPIDMVHNCSNNIQTGQNNTDLIIYKILYIRVLSPTNANVIERILFARGINKERTEQRIRKQNSMKKYIKG